MIPIRSIFRQINTTISSLCDLPIVTRALLFILTLLIPILNNFINLALLFGCCINTAIEHGEWHRLVTDPLFSHVVVSGAQLQLMMDCFNEMEQNLGSIIFLTLFVEVTFSINYLHLLYCKIGYFFTQNETFHWKVIPSIWPVVLALMIIKLSHGDRRVVQQAPLMMILLQIYDISIPNVLGMVVGYLFGRMNYWKMNALKVQTWEEGWLRGFALNQRYIAIVNSREYIALEKQEDEIV